jgi:hypothetical protein
LSQGIVPDKKKKERKLTKHAEEGEVKKLLLGHHDAVLGEDTSKDHHVHGGLVVANNDGRVVYKLLFAHDFVCNTARCRGEDAKESRDDIVDDVALVDEGTGDRNEAACNRHDQRGEKDDNAFGKELSLFGEDCQDFGKDQEVEQRDADRRLEVCYCCC